ncbi:hypothetical protein CH293_22505 [Rhodococcus sp. 14-2470-1b]|uniref:metallophosphoesterase n=1 Tax=Rhodococcus sp. 14-2470-1b TaxID=2023149 RepID=UPI000B9C43EC|nr:hypothetical protein CH293_22505 [Rhodococcus sp. 14-2470-1b]
MEQQPLAIIGDVHGQASELRAALDACLGRRHVVLVGDYVNRGTRSAEVLELVADALGDGQATALMGNHDYALLRYIASGELAPFARMGGLATINSYTGAVEEDPHSALLATMPLAHVKLLEDLLYYYEDDGLIVSHCGVPPTDPNDRSLDQLVLGSHPELFGPGSADLPKIVVSGHYAQRGSSPFVSERYICVDTGCGTIPGAPLSVLDWPERQFNYYGVQ